MPRSPQGPAVLQLLAREDQALLVRGDTLLILDLLLHILNRVRGLHIEGDGLPCHAPTATNELTSGPPVPGRRKLNSPVRVLTKICMASERPPL
jgi:hypothetical protein